MPRRLLLCVLFAAAVAPWLGTAPDAVAQDEDVKKVRIKTADEAILQATFYKSKAKQPTNSPCVILLHQPLTDPSKGDWAGLAKTVAEKGFNVLRLDFRGHGDSTLVNPNVFWKDKDKNGNAVVNINNDFMPKLAKAKPQPNKIDKKDFEGKPRYLPKLAEDIMAARVYLDQLNDDKEVNTSSVYLIGAGDAATLGLLYATTEWVRPQKIPPALIGNHPALYAVRGGGPAVGGEPAGKDVAGAIWLSPTRPRAGKLEIPDDTVQSWVQYAPDLRITTPMLCIHGTEDDAGAAGSKFLQDRVLVAHPPKGSPLQKLPLNQIVTVKGKLSGVNLLGQQLGTEKYITDYLEAAERSRQNPARIANRLFPIPPPIDLRSFGVCVK